MCYCNKVAQKRAYKILRKCPKCGQKKNFVNTENFRVNANGDRLDVWLIYQCEKCKHTYNLTIYERIKKSVVDNEEYIRLLENDKELANIFGRDKAIFKRNKAEISLKK